MAGPGPWAPSRCAILDKSVPLVGRPSAAPADASLDAEGGAQPVIGRADGSGPDAAGRKTTDAGACARPVATPKHATRPQPAKRRRRSTRRSARGGPSRAPPSPRDRAATWSRRQRRTRLQALSGGAGASAAGRRRAFGRTVVLRPRRADGRRGLDAARCCRATSACLGASASSAFRRRRRPPERAFRQSERGPPTATKQRARRRRTGRGATDRSKKGTGRDRRGASSVFAPPPPHPLHAADAEGGEGAAEVGGTCESRSSGPARRPRRREGTAQTT